VDEEVAQGSSGVDEPSKSNTVLRGLALLSEENDEGGGGGGDVSMNPMLKQVGMEYGTELVGFAKDSTKDAAMGILEEVSPLGLATELFQIGKNGTPIFSSSGPSPAETMRQMKEKKVMGIRVHSDLEVMFTGMAYIIRCSVM
jgi:hypothetical protein